MRLRWRDWAGGRVLRKAAGVKGAWGGKQLGPTLSSAKEGANYVLRVRGRWVRR